MVTLYAGTGQRGGLDGPALEAQFDGPFALALDEVGRLYVAEYGSGRLRVLDPSGVVRTWLGTPEEGVSWLRDTTSPLYRPTGLASGAAGALYIVDGRQRLLVIHPDGTWGALAQRTVGGAPVQATTGDGDVTPWQSTWDVARGADGTLYLTDALDHRVRAYTREGQTGVVAGSGQPGHQDGPAAQARFTHPNGLVLDGVGNLYIADGGSLSSLDRANPTLRRLTPQGIVETVAGDATPGYADGPAATARFQQPLLGLAMDGAGRLYVADMNNHAVRCLTPQGRVLTVAGTGTYGLRPGPGAQAELGLPADVLWDGRDGLYVADYGQNVIWRVTLPR
jgi:sugar lactone lactonase YvrE